MFESRGSLVVLSSGVTCAFLLIGATPAGAGPVAVGDIFSKEARASRRRMSGVVSGIKMSK